MFLSQTKKIHTTKGSFLIELLIAFAIISISMTVIVDAFIASQNAYYLTSEQGEITSGLALLLEDMTREARISDSFRCAEAFSPPAACASNMFAMNYIEGLNSQVGTELVSYRLQGNEIRKNYNDGSNHISAITPPDVLVTVFNVNVIVEEGQTRAVVTIKAHSNNNSDIEVVLQTSFTERIY